MVIVSAAYLKHINNKTLTIQSEFFRIPLTMTASLNCDYKSASTGGVRLGFCSWRGRARVMVRMGVAPPTRVDGGPHDRALGPPLILGHCNTLFKASFPLLTPPLTPPIGAVSIRQRRPDVGGSLLKRWLLSVSERDVRVSNRLTRKGGKGLCLGGVRSLTKRGYCNHSHYGVFPSMARD